jgi:hypothetical protein
MEEVIDIKAVEVSAEEEMELEPTLKLDLLPPTTNARSKTQRLLVVFNMSAPMQQVKNHLQGGHTHMVIKQSFPEETD